MLPGKTQLIVLYTAIEDNIESADVSDIMKKIQKIIDDSIENIVAESTDDTGKLIDLSGLNIELLEKYFLKVTNKLNCSIIER